MAVLSRENSSVTKKLLEGSFHLIMTSLDRTLAVVSGVRSGVILEACLVDIWTMITCLATSNNHILWLKIPLVRQPFSVAVVLILLDVRVRSSSLWSWKRNIAFWAP